MEITNETCFIELADLGDDATLSNFNRYIKLILSCLRQTDEVVCYSVQRTEETCTIEAEVWLVPSERHDGHFIEALTEQVYESGMWVVNA
jgi:hypothetical protein